MVASQQAGQTAPTDDEARTEALNVAGTFFQRRVVSLFRGRIPWMVIAEEYPVEYPQEGPPSERESSAMDIWLAAVGEPGLRGRAVASCQVECKKADPGFTDWVFFRKAGADHRFRHLTLRYLEDGRPALMLQQGNLTDSLCDDGRELKGDYSGRDRTKVTSARIQDAARQASLATLSSAFTLMRLSIHPFNHVRAVQIVPVVVTTANLLLCEFPVNQVDLSTGQLSPGVTATFTPRDFIVYDYPLTGGLALRADRVQFADSLVEENPESLIKMQVVILNSRTGLDRFVADVLPVARLIEGWF